MSSSDRLNSSSARAFETVIATLAVAIVQVGVAISLAALIFAGDLEQALPTAAGSFLLGTAIAAFVIGARSSFAGVVSGAQDTVAVVVASVVPAVTVGLSGETRVATALMFVVASSLIVGLAFFLVGRLHLGDLVRYVPQPVVGGFLAGTGWLLLRGGLDVMADRPIGWSELGDFTQWSNAKFLAPGLALALFIMVAAARNFRPVAISLGVLAAATLFYVVTVWSSSVDAVESAGWLIGPFESSARWAPFSWGDVQAADWIAIAKQWPALLTIALIAILGLLLNLSALEVVGEVDVDIDHELRLAGWVNGVVALVGGVSSYHLIGDTALARQLGVRTRIVPMAVGAIGIAVMTVGGRLIELVPLAIAGGMLAGLGLSLLWSWSSSYLRFASHGNRFIGLAILATIAAFGALEGVATGLVIAAAMFVVQYGRIEPIRYTLNGASARSRVDRQPAASLALDPQREMIEVVALEGYLFFGSATQTTARLREHAYQPRTHRLRHLIVDFERVTGMDVSAANALAVTASRLRVDGIDITFSSLSEPLRLRMRRHLDGAVHLADSLDHALEHCEDTLLRAANIEPVGLHAQFDQALSNHADVLMSYCERREVAGGARLIRAGDEASSLYLVESGSLSATTEANGHRLRKVGPGSLVGEIGFATGTPRSADVIADCATVVHELTHASFARLGREHPAVAFAFQAYVNRLLAERLQATTETVVDLLR